MIASATDIDWIVERIVALCDPHRIYLFGSYAKGTEHDGSDLDLLVVAPSPLPRAYRGKDVMAVLTTFPSRFDLLFYTPRELEEERRDPCSFVSMIAATARLLYVHPRTAPAEVSMPVCDDCAQAYEREPTGRRRSGLGASTTR